MKHWLILSTLSFLLVGCGGANNEATESSTKESVYIDENENYHLQGMTYSVPASWEQKVSDETRHYYYPEWGMLAVDYEEIDIALTDEAGREEFMSIYEDSVDEYELLSETRLMIADRPAYKFEFENKLSDTAFTATLVAFEYKEGIISLYLSEAAGKNVNYSAEFERMIQSIELENVPVEVDGSFDGFHLVEEDFEITITGFEVIQADDGTDRIIFNFDVTLTNNAAETTYNPVNTWIKSFRIYQGDRENELPFKALGDAKEQGIQLETLEVGQTVSSHMAYELTDLEMPVTLGTENFGHHEISILEEDEKE